jgi:TRAP-type mannitol/chloroaromatic compound transport system permease small subunit
LDEEKQLQSIASMLFFTPLWSFCIFLALAWASNWWKQWKTKPEATELLLEP